MQRERKVEQIERKVERKVEQIEKEVEILKRIQCLPVEIINQVHQYIPSKSLLFLNKKEYIKNHIKVKKYILKNQYENYIRDMIRRDNSFVFFLLFRENAERWLHFKKYMYNACIYSNYIYFLLEYCIQNHSEKCKHIVNTYLQESGLSKNQHKKNTVTNIRWTN
jgi:hypothetical protein